MVSLWLVHIFVQKNIKEIFREIDLFLYNISQKFRENNQQIKTLLRFCVSVLRLLHLYYTTATNIYIVYATNTYFYNYIHTQQIRCKQINKQLTNICKQTVSWNTVYCTILYTYIIYIYTTTNYFEDCFLLWLFAIMLKKCYINYNLLLH